MEKKEYKYINILRVILCLIVLMYHLNILNGGYLAVCSFLVISGYLGYTSLNSKKDFSIKNYYKNRFVRLYLPMVLVLFLVIGTLFFFHSITWINIKRETISILFGYNNFWQLHNNLDYFTMSLKSPFVHYWYISLLIQFDLFFPLLYLFVKKLKDKFNKLIPIIFLSILSFASIVAFIILGYMKYEAVIYYHTLTRLYALLLGVLLGFIHTNYLDKIINTLNKKGVIFFWGYVAIILCCCIFGLPNTILFIPLMILISFTTCRLLDYIQVIDNDNIFGYKITKYVSDISYEIYLVSYPIIFVLQELGVNHIYLIVLTIVITFVASTILHYSLSFIDSQLFNWKKIVKTVSFIIIILFSLGGIYYYTTCQNPVLELKQLENQIKSNETLMKEKQQSYKIVEEQKMNSFNDSISELDAKIDNLENEIKNASIVGIGDSVMLGALDELYKTFPNSYFDAKVSRTAWVAGDIINGLKQKKLLGDIVIFNLGANGDCPSSCKEKLLNSISDKEIFWLTVTNDRNVNVNKTIWNLAEKHPNLHVIDWNTISKGHKEYFIADKIHLTAVGAKAYSKAILDNIYKYYLNLYQNAKDTLTEQYDTEQRQGHEFYGDHLLLNVYNLINNFYPDAKFSIAEDYDVDKLLLDLENSKKENVVLVFSKKINISSNKLNEIMQKLSDRNVYLITDNKLLTIGTYLNLQIIDLSNLNKDYYIYDNIHLNELGNNYLKKVLISINKDVNN